MQTTNGVEAPQPPPCNPNIFREGIPVLMLGGLAREVIEAQVAFWRRELWVPLDWTYAGDWAVVYCTRELEEEVRAKLGSFAVEVRNFPAVTKRTPNDP